MFLLIDLFSFLCLIFNNQADLPLPSPLSLSPRSRQTCMLYLICILSQCYSLHRVRVGGETSTLRRNLTLMQGGSYNVDVPGKILTFYSPVGHLRGLFWRTTDKELNTVSSNLYNPAGPTLDGMNDSINSCNTNQLLIMEALLIKFNKHELNSGLKACKELSRFT